MIRKCTNALFKYKLGHLEIEPIFRDADNTEAVDGEG